MIILRGYKSVVFWLMFGSLWIIGLCTCCKEKEGDETKKKVNTNVDNRKKNNLNNGFKNNEEKEGDETKKKVNTNENNKINNINYNNKINENYNNITNNIGNSSTNQNTDIIKNLKGYNINNYHNQQDIKNLSNNINYNNENIDNYNNPNNIGNYFTNPQNNMIDESSNNINYNNENINSYLDSNQKQPILVGLNNIGATCYMNATLQALSNTKDLTEYFLGKYEKEYNDKAVMVNGYREVLKNLWDEKNHNKAYSPYSFRFLLEEKNPLFTYLKAQDPKDLVIFLIQQFHQELNHDKGNIVMPPGYETDEEFTSSYFVKEFKEKFNSPISNLFIGISEKKAYCDGCKTFTYFFSTYNFLEFSLQAVHNFCYDNNKKLCTTDEENPEVDLYDCFKEYKKKTVFKENNKMWCNICGESCTGYCNDYLYSCPKYLIIYLSRGKNAAYKCDVNFPEQINISEFVTSENDGKSIYNLYAVICHLGESGQTGHLIAYCKNRIDNKWYCYNDKDVTACTRDQQYKEQMPYILFYERV